MSRFTQTFSIPADHPALEGHFPNNPIVPGTIILDRMAAAVESHLPTHHVGKITRIKFHMPLRPNQVVRIVVELNGSAGCFKCFSDSYTIATGDFLLLTED